MTHASHLAIKRAWNTLTNPVRRPAWFDNEPQIEAISVSSPFDQPRPVATFRGQLRANVMRRTHG
jgi:hypothetical protein